MPSMLKASGWYTSPNILSSVQEGALVIAENVVIRHANVLESRRGYYAFGSVTATPTDRVSEMYAFNQRLMVLYNNTTLSRDTTGAGVFADVPIAPGVYTSTLAPVDVTSARVRAIEHSQAFIISSKNGTFYLDSSAGSLVPAGAPRAASFSVHSNSSTIESGLGVGAAGTPPQTGNSVQNSQVAYRVVFGFRDANNRVILGVPSGRLVFGVPPDLTIAIGQAARTASSDIVLGGSTPLPIAFTTAVKAFLNLLSGLTTTYDPADSGAGQFVSGFCPLAMKQGSAAVTTTTLTYNQTTASSGVGTNTVAASLSFAGLYFKLGFYLPPGLTTSFFYRVYKTYTTVNAATPPDDECFLAIEKQLTAGDIANGYVMVQDRTPDSFLGDPLYTNSNTGEGGGFAATANERPPVARDLALFQDRVWYGNTIGKQIFNLQLLGVGTPDGVQNGDTVTIAGRTYTADTTSNIDGQIPNSTPHWWIQMNPVFAPSQQVAQVAQRLVNAVNADTGAVVTAYYTSGSSDPPGKMLFVERSINGAALAATASRPASWFPFLPGNFDATKYPHGGYYSKPGQPDAVPLNNFFTAGSKNKQLLREMQLQDSLYLFKEDGIYRLNGQPPWRIEFLDPAILVCPDSAVVLGNQIYGLTHHGVVAVGPSGVGVISRPIERELLGLIATIPAQVKQYGKGIAYEAERVYKLMLPTSAGDTIATQTFVYNYFTNTWSRETRASQTGFVNPINNTLYVAQGGAPKISAERKNFELKDYADEDFPIAILSTDPLAVTLCCVAVVSAAGIFPGDMIEQGAQNAIIRAINGTTLMLNTPTTFAVGGATIFPGIPCQIQYAPQTYGAPEKLKHVRECSIHLRASSFTLCTVGFLTEQNTALQVETFNEVALSTKAPLDPVYGAYTFGSDPLLRNARFILPPESQRGAYLTISFSIREARSAWQLLGYTLSEDPTSSRDSQ